MYSLYLLLLSYACPVIFYSISKISSILPASILLSRPANNRTLKPYFKMPSCQSRSKVMVKPWMVHDKPCLSLSSVIPPPYLSRTWAISKPYLSRISFDDPTFILRPSYGVSRMKRVSSSFQCCIRDGSRSAAYAIQLEYANPLKVLCSKGMVLNVQAKGGAETPSGACKEAECKWTVEDVSKWIRCW